MGFRKSTKYESVTRVNLDRGGYVASAPHKGRYFGVGAPLYRGVDRETGILHYVRAANRDAAIDLLDAGNANVTR